MAHTPENIARAKARRQALPRKIRRCYTDEILAAIHAGADTSTAIADHLGLSRIGVRQCLWRLCKQGRVTQLAKDGRWVRYARAAS